MRSNGTLYLRAYSTVSSSISIEVVKITPTGQANEIGIHAVRRGEIIGIHEVLISTGTQTITLKHEAHDRALFAEGALDAAAFLLGKEAGLYNMNAMIG